MASVQHPAHQSLLGQYAGFATRAIAFAIDVAVLSTTIVVVSWFVTTTIEMLIGGATFQWILETIPYLNRLYGFFVSPVTHSVIAIAFIISYYLFFWTFVGQTPGKYFMGVRIITMDGKPLRLHQSILRYAGYYISAIFLGLGFFWILIDDQRRGWHDRFAGTCVIYYWDARPDERFLKSLTNQIINQGKQLKAVVRKHKGLQSTPAIDSTSSGLIASDRTDRYNT